MILAMKSAVAHRAPPAEHTDQARRWSVQFGSRMSKRGQRVQTLFGENHGTRRP